MKKHISILTCAVTALCLTFSSQLSAQCGSCPPGVQGPAGSQGPAGTQGTQGAQGSDGGQGIQGAQGPRGPAGTSGTVGATGAAGPSPLFCGILTFTNPGSLLKQYVSPGANVLFETPGLTTPDIDLTNAATTGQIIVNTAGTYFIIFTVTGQSQGCSGNPWSFGLYINGVLQPTTIEAAITSYDGDFKTYSGHLIGAFQAGQVLTLQNTSYETVVLLNDVSGGSQPNASAVLDAFLLTSATTF